MIYFLHIKNTDNLNCKWLFKTLEEMQRFFRRELPTKLVIEVERRRIIDEATGETEEYMDKQIVSGRNLERLYEECIDIVMIDEAKCPKWPLLFRAKFYEFDAV